MGLPVINYWGKPCISCIKDIGTHKKVFEIQGI